jgi:hypothetical protein
MERTGQQQLGPDAIRLSRGAPFFSLFMVGLAILAYLDLPTKRISPSKLNTSDCELWDQGAVEAITPLLYGNSAKTDLQLNEALTHLRRARSYCRSGSVAVARNDYASLLHAFPMATGSTRPVPISVPDRSLNKTSLDK